MPSWDRDLWALSRPQVRPERMCLGPFAFWRRDRYRQWSSGMPKPVFVCVDPVPGRNLIGLQEVVNRGRARPVRPFRTKRFGIMPAFGMWLHIQQANDLVRTKVTGKRHGLEPILAPTDFAKGRSRISRVPHRSLQSWDVCTKEGVRFKLTRKPHWHGAFAA